MSVRADKGWLFLDFRYRGSRHREYLGLPDTSEGRRIAGVRSDLVNAEIAAGTFNYAAHFPNSRRAVVLEIARRADDVEIPESITRAAVDRGPCVYAVQLGEDGPIKIGWTGDLRARLRNLQSANPARLRLLAACPGDRSIEWSLHQRAKASLIRGEWFHPTAEVRRLVCELGVQLLQEITG